ncbi:MAG: AmmeMemoRadiSam system protein B [Anaerolineae bacterium]|nr:AmmeMemoRadiSam system protein B [Anaerolineae bacterium]
MSMRIYKWLLPILILSLCALGACSGRSRTTAPAAPGMSEAEGPIAITVTPGTQPSDWIRPPAVAGSWYPDDPDKLTQMIDDMLNSVKLVDGAPIGLIVPHAGYAYSGPVAAYGFKQLENGKYDTAIIIAADHQPPVSHPISVWAKGGFRTPLGVVPVDEGIAQALIDASPLITFDPAAHQGEHPIEIELPFLQQVCPTCRIVPILMGTDDDQAIQALADALIKVLPGKRAVIIASSDLSHYPRYEDARRVDSATLGAIETGDPDAVRSTIRKTMKEHISNLVTCACGEAPILVTMRVARGLGANTTTVLHYANSGDVPGGDRERVVGYGAVMFWHYTPPDLTPKRRQTLLTLARRTLENYLEQGTLLAYKTDDPVLNRRAGAFVTLKEHGRLRGCIGHIRADTPLYRVVQEMAIAAGTQDPRFRSLKREELNQTTIEISVLSPFHRVTDTNQIRVGVDGLMIVKGKQRGLLLPQVPVEQGWDRHAFLEGLCEKAFLPEDCWQKDATLYAFTAIVFGEE